MGIPTLIKTLTASNDASLSFVDGTADVTLDSTYDEYMFVFTDINPVTDSTEFTFQVNVDGQSGYNEIVTSAGFYSYHTEAGTESGLAYSTLIDQAQGTAGQVIMRDVGNGADESGAGILHLFTPSNTTYVTHFYSETSSYHKDNAATKDFAAGYFNVTGAIDEIEFKFSAGNFDGVIQMYGIS